MAFNWRKFPWTNLHDLNLDWIIQTVKTLEENLADALALVQTTVDAAITRLTTGSGDFTISKTGDVNISGNSVKLSKTVISAGNEQLTMHNPNSNTSVTANYNSGVLTLTNNQNAADGIALYAIKTPADGGGDNSDFAANVGYVKDAAGAVDSKLDTEITNRTSGDAALQSSIDLVMNLLTNLKNRVPFSLSIIWAAEANSYTLTDKEYAILRQSLLDKRPVFIVRNTAADGGEQTIYMLRTCATPSTLNVDSMTLVLQGPSNSIQVQMASKTIVPNIQ